MSYRYWLLLVALFLVTLARANYIMDDRNSTIKYDGTWSQELSGAYIDSSKVFDGTA